MAAPITTSIDVDRPPARVFAYVTDPSRFVEWQKGVVSGHMDGGGTPQVGEKCLSTRRIGFAERPVTSELTQIAGQPGKRSNSVWKYHRHSRFRRRLALARCSW